MANRVRAILAKDSSIKNLTFDTTGVGYFEAPKGATPDAAKLNEALTKGRVSPVKVTKLEQVEVPKPDAVFELSIAELA